MADIIVPVYNAPDYLESCIESVLRHTNLSKHRLIIINDCSTDPAVDSIIARYKKNDGIMILQNDKNLGFVCTVNKGMRYSQNDVVLLNSDTQVTKNYMEKLTLCAYKNENTATVTPLSNNGEITSVPVFLRSNPLPSGFTLDEYADFIERVSLKDYPSIPTGVGFCMFIKRSAIDKIGFFDEDNFGLGYGEENDFCYRASLLGYTHALCDDTFILHKGEQSFAKKKGMLVMQNSIKLDKMYKKLRANTNKFISEKKTDYIGQNILRELCVLNPAYADEFNLLPVKRRGDFIAFFTRGKIKLTPKLRLLAYKIFGR